MVRAIYLGRRIFLVRVWCSKDNELLSKYNGSFAIISMSIVNGYVGMYLLDALHASNAEMGLLNSLQSLLNLFAMLAAAVAIRRTKSKKVFCAVATTISRSFYVWIALVPLLPFSQAALWVVWLVAIGRMPQSFGDLSWQAMIGDIIPAERRSAFFSERNRVTTLVGLVVTLLCGLLLEQFDKNAVFPYQAVFLSTAVFAFFEVFLLLRHDESQHPNGTPEAVTSDNRVTVRQKLNRFFQDRKAIRAMLAMLLFNFAWQLSWPLFNIFQISVAHASALWLGLFQVANSATQILTFKWWGNMAEKYGNAKMLAFAAIGMATAPILTVLSTNMWYLFVLNLFTGIPLAGTLLLLFNYLLEVSPEEERTSYIANYNVALSVIGAVAPEVGIWLLDSIGMVGGMLTSTLLRLVAGAVFLWVAVRTNKRHRRTTGNVASDHAHLPVQ
jgi:MFS family permease